MGTSHDGELTEGTAPAADEIDLPREPGRLRQWMNAHPRTVDALIATITGLPYVVIVVVTGLVERPSVWETTGSILTVLGVAACVMFRRRFPLATVLAATAFSALPGIYSLGGVVAMYVLLYSLGSRATGWKIWVGYGVTALVTIVASVVYALVQDLGAVFAGVPLAVFLLVPLLIGISVGNRRRYTSALIQRAHDLARERDQRAQLAVSTERARIAREMHDVISHSLTVMVTLSEGAAAQSEANSPAAEAMRMVAATGRSSLTEMRRLLGVLRTESDAADPRAPQPTEHDLDGLVSRFRSAGLPVVFDRTGAPLDDPRVEVTIFRIAQEALTNVLRHAPTADSVRLRIDHRPGTSVQVDVTNSRAPQPSLPLSPGSGTGLIGVRERVTLLGGEVIAAPDASGGWRTSATIPLTGESDDEAPVAISPSDRDGSALASLDQPRTVPPTPVKDLT